MIGGSPADGRTAWLNQVGSERSACSGCQSIGHLVPGKSPTETILFAIWMRRPAACSGLERQENALRDRDPCERNSKMPRGWNSQLERCKAVESFQKFTFRKKTLERESSLRARQWAPIDATGRTLWIQIIRGKTLIEPQFFSEQSSHSLAGRSSVSKAAGRAQKNAYAFRESPKLIIPMTKTNKLASFINFRLGLIRSGEEERSLIKIDRKRFSEERREKNY